MQAPHREHLSRMDGCELLLRAVTWNPRRAAQPGGSISGWRGGPGSLRAKAGSRGLCGPEGAWGFGNPGAFTYVL